jgi:hypothetical protein
MYLYSESTQNILVLTSDIWESYISLLKILRPLRREEQQAIRVISHYAPSDSGRSWQANRTNHKQNSYSTGDTDNCPLLRIYSLHLYKLFTLTRWISFSEVQQTWHMKPRFPVKVMWDYRGKCSALASISSRPSLVRTRRFYSVICPICQHVIVRIAPSPLFLELCRLEIHVRIIPPPFTWVSHISTYFNV